ncbi:MAG: hypothetical protein HN413_04995 [Chloroflexi bacterium]|nr:hypothetical protein [Chloroflexota bacterium]
MSETPARSPLWLRFAAIGAGIVTLFWLPIEDTQINIVTLLALFIAAFGAAHTAYKRRAPKFHGVPRAALIGLLAGASATLIALLLIALKTGLHSHGAPDFTLTQITTLIQRTPYFAIGGLLVALGCAVWMYNRDNR